MENKSFIEAKNVAIPEKIPCKKDFIKKIIKRYNF